MVKLGIHRLVKKGVGFFRQGSSPKGLAMSGTLGLLAGIFPIFGITTWLLALLAVPLRINLPLTVTVSYLVWPVQVLLIVPFMRLGEWAYESKPLQLTTDALQAAFLTDFFGALQKFWDANLNAATGWLLVAAPLGLLLYGVLFQGFRYFFEKRKLAPGPAEGAAV